MTLDAFNFVAPGNLLPGASNCCPSSALFNTLFAALFAINRGLGRNWRTLAATGLDPLEYGWAARKSLIRQQVSSIVLKTECLI
jgi:hypothetical protein